MPSHSSNERSGLADALLAVGPDAPTLCAGWTARDLAAHLVVREGRADAALGIVVPPLAGYGESVRRKVAGRPFEDLVSSFRSGPPRLSWARLPMVEEMVNHTEYFVHTEDVLRAGTGATTPRALPEGQEQALWAGLVRSGKLLFRKAGSGVTLAWPAAGKERRIRSGQPEVVLRGAPGELVLFAFGRGDHAQVSIEGPDDAVAALKALDLGM